MAVGAFQTDAFDGFTFQVEYEAALATTEALDVMSITAGIVGTASLDVTEDNDTASFTSTATTEVSFVLTEQKDVVSVDVTATTYVNFNAYENTDVVHFEVFTTFLTFDITELPDTYYGRVFSAFFTEGEADIIQVQAENRTIILPPAPDRSTIEGGQYARTGHVPSELQRIEIDQTRATRREDQ